MSDMNSISTLKLSQYKLSIIVFNQKLHILIIGDGEEEEEDEEDYEAESSDEDAEEDISMTEEPGNDSGCTAVVALLRG